MAVSASDVGRPSVARRLFELDPLPTERLKLETAPRVDTVASFVFTRAAERSWEVLNQHLAANEGAVFWIGGPAGCGKTHFLDYVIALESRLRSWNSISCACSPSKLAPIRDPATCGGRCAVWPR